MSKAYIGYDLGDGETITDITILDDQQTRTAVQTLFMPMEMPDNNTPGQAVPTAFAIDEDGKVVFASSILDDPAIYQQICVNFKRRPSDMVRRTDDKRTNEIIDAFKNSSWPTSQEVPEADFSELNKFRDTVVAFTNAIFNDEKYATKVHDAIISCDSIMFCVGHPTRWDKLDIAIYKAILTNSILGAGVYAGKPSEFIMDAESRAAFLYVSDKSSATVLPQGKAVLLIDVGSSTIDVTATTADSRNHLYNSGNNYLGVRCIDFIIRDWYLKKLKEDPEDWEVYQELIRQNPTMKMALTLSCRKAKEAVFSLAAKKAKIVFADFAPVRITQDDVNNLVEKYPIADVLKDTVGIPADAAMALGNKTWIQLFREFVTDQKTTLEAQGISIGRIILTGSASKMPFVKTIVSDIFDAMGEGGVLSDLDPSRSISMGLALIGPRDAEGRLFQTEVDNLINNTVPECIKRNIGDLGESLGKIVEKEIFSIVMNRMRQWKAGNYTTLDDMTEAIRRDCSKERLNEILQNNSDYNNAIHNWAVEKVGTDIAIELKALCEKFGVTNITIDQLNVFKVPEITIDGLPNPTEGILDAIMAVVSIIAGIVTYIVLPTVLGIVIGIISLISVDIAALLLSLLLAIPGEGLVLLIAIAGIAVVTAVRRGLRGAKEQMLKKIQKFDLPDWSRRLVTDDKVQEQLNKSNMSDKIKAAIMNDESQDQIAISITENIRGQITDKTDAIRFLI